MTIVLPPSLRGPASSEHGIILPRGHLQLEVRLPIGSSEAKYTLRILDRLGKVLRTASGTAHTEDRIAKLSVALDTSNLIPGDYKLNVLAPGLDEWSNYPLIAK